MKMFTGKHVQIATPGQVSTKFVDDGVECETPCPTCFNMVRKNYDDSNRLECEDCGTIFYI